jgi:hypothetical protein
VRAGNLDWSAEITLMRRDIRAQKREVAMVKRAGIATASTKLLPPTCEPRSTISVANARRREKPLGWGALVVGNKPMPFSPRSYAGVATASAKLLPPACELRSTISAANAIPCGQLQLMS